MPLIEEIKVPLLAVNDTTLTVVELSCPPGSKVAKGDAILVFETSKTTYEVEAAAQGYIQYLCAAGRDYEVNAVVARIYSDPAEALAAPVADPKAGSAPPTAGSYGSSAAALSAGSRPATTTFPAASAAFPSTAVFPATAGSPAGTLTFAGEPLAHWGGETLFSQEARKLMATHGLEASVFAGRDFVSALDILRLLHPAEPAGYTAAAPPAGNPAAAGTPAAHTGYTAATAASPTTRRANESTSATVDPNKAVAEKLTSAKRLEIEYLSAVQEAGLTSTIHTYVETEGIFIHLNRSLRYLKNSLLPVIVYEVSRLLTDYPLLNAWFTGDGIAQYKDVNPGFAIDIDKGLKVAKIAAAGQKSLAEIEAAILALSGDYLDDKLKLEDLTDITFTITDLSAEAVALFQPLINKTNSAILGISAIDEKWQRCTLSLTFDHRVTEGRAAARFLKELKDRLESYRPPQGTIKKDIACFKCYKTLAEDLGHTGFMHCITPEGKEGYICQSCLKGF